LFPNLEEIEAKTELLLSQLGFPIDFSISKGLIAFSSTLINKKFLVDSVKEKLGQTSL